MTLAGGMIHGLIYFGVFAFSLAQEGGKSGG